MSLWFQTTSFCNQEIDDIDLVFNDRDYCMWKRNFNTLYCMQTMQCTKLVQIGCQFHPAGRIWFVLKTFNGIVLPVTAIHVSVNLNVTFQYLGLGNVVHNLLDMEHKIPIFIFGGRKQLYQQGHLQSSNSKFSAGLNMHHI